MSAKRRLPRDQRRRTLLDAARTVCMERGYGDLTMGRVARRAGVSKTLVYDHFASRRELYLAVLAEEQVRLVQRLAPPLAQGDRPGRVHAAVHAFLELVQEYGDGYAELFRNPIAHDPDLADELLRTRDAVAEMIAGIIAIDIGVEPDEVRLPAYAIVGTMEAAADHLTRLSPDEQPDLAHTADLLARLIWQGLEGVEALASADGAGRLLALPRPA